MIRPSATFNDALTTCLDVLGNSPEVRHVSKSKLGQFAFDISIVAAAVRSGYLFDAFTLRNSGKTLKEFLLELLATLRQKFDIFKGVALLHEPSTDQIFVVNVPKLGAYYDPACDALNRGLLSWVKFLEVDGSKTKVTGPPVALSKMLGATLPRSPANTGLPLLLTLPEDDARTLGDMVALAACLLEFPVAYVPKVDGSDAFLAGVPLDVYGCVLEQSSPSPLNHVMLKFSCPQAMATEVLELRQDVLIDRLRSRFGDRLGQAGVPGRLVIRHNVQTMDRVAL